jgi:translation initiation factor 2 gamma subunit (eIF-2gamma)
LKKLILVLIGAILLGPWRISIVNAQGFVALFEKIDNLEARIDHLEGKINSAVDQSGTVQFDMQLAGLEQRIIALSENKFDLLKINTCLVNLGNRTGGSQPSANPNQIEEFIAEPSVLSINQS